jgi:hypothetical protein
MNKPSMILLAAALLATTSTTSEARHYRHSRCGHGLYDANSQSNSLSPLGYLFPAADWGPFLGCRIYVSPVLTLPPDRY